MKPGSEPTRCFQMGVVRAALSTPLTGLLDEYTALYTHTRIADNAPADIHVTVRPKPRRPWKRSRFDVTVNGRLQFEPGREDEILPHVEWAINWEVPRILSEFLHLHASSMAFQGAGVIFPGLSGSGKSTLTAGLLTRGWHYLCDEFAIIHADTLMLHPYPRAICIKKPSHAVVEALGLQFHGRRHYLKGAKGYVGFINPAEARRDALGRTCPIHYVIFPKYIAGAEPALRPISRGEAAFALHEVCFNLFGCSKPGLEVIARMIRRAACYRLTSGDLNQTCDLLEELLAHPGARAASA